LIVLPAAGRAATVTIGAAKDNTIFQSDASHSAGGAAGLRAGTNGMGSPRRGLIAFDVAGNLPANAMITSARLTLYLGNAPLADFQDIRLHRLTRDWGEGTAGSDNPAISGTGMGSPAAPGDATWSHAMSGSAAWSSDGAQGDIHAIASATAPVGGPVDSPFTWNSTPALVADVQNWLDAPATNFGWALVNAHEEIIRSQKVFYSREATQNSSGEPNSLDATWRPSLTISYLSSSPPSGDYNGNGVVDVADFVVWRKTLNLVASPAGSGADGNESGTIDDGDYIFWVARFGNVVVAAQIASVPEPVTGTLLLLAGALAFARKRR
jgi:MprA protease rhombosortase-interaction domain-containing protein